MMVSNERVSVTGFKMIMNIQLAKKFGFNIFS
jgi:hypothetical protein